MSEASIKFEVAIKRLEEIVKQMEQGSASLDDSLKLFEEGMSLIKNCTKQLDEAELKVVRLMKGEDGKPIERTLTDEAGE